MQTLERERAQASFDPRVMSRFLLGDEYLSLQARLLRILESDPIFDQSQVPYMSRKELLRKALLMGARQVALRRHLNWSFDEFEACSKLVDISSMLNLHEAMFIPCLRAQGTPEQQQRFLEPAMNYEIIGCYAQTELGHGSNVQGLETTATFLPETEEFELHSPNLTSTKWWSGGLGLAATHAIVMARLLVRDTDFGPHPFVVPIRSLEDHQPFPGVQVGDIGPKFGFNSVDNGFMRFQHYHIPRDHMLERFARVTPQGKYVRPPNDKLSYGTMVYVRQYIVRNSAINLAKAATIAIRYCATRRQFAADKNETQGPTTKPESPPSPGSEPGETSVLNYSMVQYRLLPALAQAYALHFTGLAMRDQYNDFVQRLAANDVSTLAELHATSSGLKALSTDMLVDSIEVCRRAMGGHGYSAFSGLTDFYCDTLPNTTWEGDNFILSQQVARYLLKAVRRQMAATRCPPSSQGRGNKDSLAVAGNNSTQAYLQAYFEWVITSTAQLDDLNLLLTLFGHRSAALVAQLQRAMDQDHQTWNQSLVDMRRISQAHGQYTILYHFVKTMDVSTTATPEIRRPLAQLWQLLALHTLVNDGGLTDCLEMGLLAPHQASWIRQRERELLTHLRPNAVALADAWAIPDYRLKSALGNYRGDVYERLMKGALHEPANHMSPVVGRYQQLIAAT
ncbi:acyl-CoA dehydrogenase/oxidase [Dimargaris cristalligena]|uniref:Acyl-coenzyme A oxidase n=1 Tax=Dimargaris cristalligena TaxID=215637 RepID=A0A4V1J4Z6_9FUNG|nr:acyl-CoA dehydrogenase/oxidase [Dimargaris cristalligena]|eukprot:RKP37289.1 acyl-CoA dehydrogenase/oxidase [Dimargaris cristalligena]